MKDLWKLKWSLYADEDYEIIETYKADENYKLFAKKGQIAERLEITDEIREQYGIYDDMWKTIYIFKNGNYLLCQEEYSGDFFAYGKVE